MAELRILAIEDDPIFAEKLKQTIEEIGHLLIDVTDDVSEFKRLIKATLPDLLLLDIDLGLDQSGIELAEEIAQTNECPFIFITSHQDLSTARRALESIPSSYITKPIDAASLLVAIELAQERRLEVKRNFNISTNDFFVKVDGAHKRYSYQEISFIEVKGRSCFLMTTEGSRELKVKLKDLLNQLTDTFTQVHRSYVINLEKVDQIDAQFQYVTIGDVSIPIGRNYKDILIQRINKLG